MGDKDVGAWQGQKPYLFMSFSGRHGNFSFQIPKNVDIILNVEGTF